ncbi:MAG TPA: hypothetical protein VL978_09800 [Puia sp.]|nr:hypothetical protein [Puia sp.]
MRVLSVVAVLWGVFGLVACNQRRKPEVPSTKAVDSAVRGAADTIKAIALDSLKYKVRSK